MSDKDIRLKKINESGHATELPTRAFFDLRYSLQGLDRADLRKSFIGQSILAYAVPEKQSLEASWRFRLYLDNE